MTTTPSPTPELLSDEALKEIEARHLKADGIVDDHYSYEYAIAASLNDIPALCASLRAAWKQRDDALVRGAEDQDSDSAERALLAKENAALRDQLVQAQSELKQWLQWGDRMTGGQHYLQSKMRYEIESRLAEAEKTTERNPA